MRTRVPTPQRQRSTAWLNQPPDICRTAKSFETLASELVSQCFDIKYFFTTPGCGVSPQVLSPVHRFGHIALIQADCSSARRLVGLLPGCAATEAQWHRNGACRSFNGTNVRVSSADTRFAPVSTVPPGRKGQQVQQLLVHVYQFALLLWLQPAHRNFLLKRLFFLPVSPVLW